MAGSVKRMFSVDRIVITLLFEYLQQNPNDQRRFGLNLSADTIAQNGRFFSFLIKELKTRDIDPARLVFEINEHATNTDRESLIEWIKYLESMGACFALDDFGVGETNFLTIKHLIARSSCFAPCKNFVKIDCSFVNGIDQEDNQEIIQTIANLCRIYNALSIAECVNTRYQYEQLKALGVHLGQGFFGFASEIVDGKEVPMINAKPQLLYEPTTPVYASLIEQE